MNNKFIVWYSNDINKDKFSKEFTLDQLISQDHLDEICDSPFLVNYKVDSINNGIGLEDIEGNKIYADSSIFEFSFETIFTISYPKIRGFFYFDDSIKAYRIKLLSTLVGIHSKTENLVYHSGTTTNFKIIDTIQENKLGLIK